MRILYARISPPRVKNVTVPNSRLVNATEVGAPGGERLYPTKTRTMQAKATMSGAYRYDSQYVSPSGTTYSNQGVNPRPVRTSMKQIRASRTVMPSDRPSC